MRKRYYYEKEKSVDFLIQYEVKNREFDSICLLAAYLEQKGFTVAFVNTWDALFHEPTPYSAKVLLISACYDDDVYNYFCSHASAFEKVVNLQWEQIRINRVVNGTEILWPYSGVAKKTRHICWGPKQIAYLSGQMGIEQEYLYNCGYLPIDFYREPIRMVLPDRQSLFEKYGLDKTKTTLLFVSSFAQVGLPKEDAKNNYSQETRDFIYETSVESQRAILGWMKRLCGEQPKLQVIYRPHPAEIDNPEIRRIEDEISNFYVIPEESIKNWINACDLLYNWQSTSMIEMFASGKPTFLLRPVHIPSEFDLPYYVEGEYVEISTYEGFAETVHSMPDKRTFPVSENNLLAMYSMMDEPAYQRTGDFLIQTFYDSRYRSRPAKRTVFDKTEKKHEDASISVRFKRALRNNHLFLSACHLLAPMIGYSTIGYKIKKIDRELTEKFAAQKEKDCCDSKETDDYRRQKMLQNRADESEIRNRIDEYKAILEQILE